MIWMQGCIDSFKQQIKQLKQQKMGGCINKKQVRSSLSQPPEFKQNQQRQPNTNIYHPIPTTLYNLLRKSNQLQIIHKNKIFPTSTYPNITALQDKDIKLLYSFKNILTIGQCTQIINRILSAANPKIIYALQQNQANNFITRFPIFQTLQDNKNNGSKQLPIFVINSEQVIKKGSKKQIYLHSRNNINNQVYTLLGIEEIINYNQQHTIQQIAKQLQHSGKQKILLLHAAQIKPDVLLNVLATYLINEYKVNQLNAKIYIRRSLPQISLTQTPTIQKTMPTITSQYTLKQIKQIPKQNLTVTQLYQKYLHQLYIQLGQNQSAKNKNYRSYNLLITLIANIYNNKGSQNYRTIRKTNKQINQLLGKYKNGVKLLKQIGFVDDGGVYVNNVDVKYLKIYRMDLEMAYRNFIDSIKQ